MGNIGFRELLIILVIALLIFGAKRLRGIGSDLGAAVRGFKKSMGEGEKEDVVDTLPERLGTPAEDSKKNKVPHDVG